MRVILMEIENPATARFEERDDVIPVHSVHGHLAHMSAGDQPVLQRAPRTHESPRQSALPLRGLVRASIKSAK